MGQPIAIRHVHVAASARPLHARQPTHWTGITRAGNDPLHPPSAYSEAPIGIEFDGRTLVVTHGGGRAVWRLTRQVEAMLSVLPILPLETPVDVHYAEISPAGLARVRLGDDAESREVVPT
jgi:hypothetical protein